MIQMGQVIVSMSTHAHLGAVHVHFDYMNLSLSPYIPLETCFNIPHNTTLHLLIQTRIISSSSNGTWFCDSSKSGGPCNGDGNSHFPRGYEY